jgi:hypothetical protein
MLHYSERQIKGDFSDLVSSELNVEDSRAVIARSESDAAISNRLLRYARNDLFCLLIFAFYYRSPCRLFICVYNKKASNI